MSRRLGDIDTFFAATGEIGWALAEAAFADLVLRAGFPAFSAMFVVLCGVDTFSIAGFPTHRADADSPLAEAPQRTGFVAFTAMFSVIVWLDADLTAPNERGRTIGAAGSIDASLFAAARGGAGFARGVVVDLSIAIVIDPIASFGLWEDLTKAAPPHKYALRDDFAVLHARLAGRGGLLLARSDPPTITRALGAGGAACAISALYVVDEAIAIVVLQIADLDLWADLAKA